MVQQALAKPEGILDEHGNSNVYRDSDYLHPFDGYGTQEVIAFDEFRSGIKISDMLNYCDIYPIELPARYSNKFACYSRVYIISNWSLEMQYSEVQKNSPESWQAFLRRFMKYTTIMQMERYDVYDSVEKYLHWDEEFHAISDEELKQIKIYRLR